MRAARLVGIVLIVVAAAGCWPVPGAGPDRRAHNPFETRITPGTVASLDEAWTRTFAHEGGPRPLGDPVLSSRGIHVTGAGTRISYLAVHNVRWDGTTRWVYEEYDSVFRDVLVVDGAVAVTDFASYEYWYTTFVDPDSGTPTGPPGGVASRGRLGGVRDGRAVYEDAIGSASSFGSDGFRVVDVEAGTSWLGTHRPGAAPMTLGRDLLFDTGPGVTAVGEAAACCGNGVRAQSYEDPQCTIEAYPGDEWASTCPEWATPVDGGETSAAVVSEDQATVYVLTDAGTAHALDTTTGAVRWSTAVGSENPYVFDAPAAPALADGTLFVPTESGQLVALDAATGGERWSATVGSAVLEQPAVAGGVVVAASVEGGVRAYDAAGCGAATCEALWSDDLGSRVTGAPAIGFGLVVVGTADGRLVAYAPDSPTPAAARR